MHSIPKDKAGVLKTIRESIIGEGEYVDGPFGSRLQTYVDFTASGKALGFIENYIQTKVLPLYANTHTESSFTGMQTQTLREEAREAIKRSIHATDEHALIFTGSGVTAAIDKIIHVLGLDKTNNELPPVIFIGPYEHHSNELPWREAMLEVVTIREDANGQIDVAYLENELKKRENTNVVKIGAFSGASNVTGIISDVSSLCAIMHKYNGLCFIDYATGGPYLPIDMSRSSSSPDAIFLSPHKFVGGPGTPGILVARRALFINNIPSTPGGGTVLYVGHRDQVYDKNIEAREEAGTPDIVGSIRAGLVFKLKMQVGEELIQSIEDSLIRRAMDKLKVIPNIKILGDTESHRLPVLSFVIMHQGRAMHHHFIALLFSDLFGIQLRSGCSCAGPYGHRLLNIEDDTSQNFKNAIVQGYIGIKPGWVRLNFPYWIEERQFQFLLSSIEFIANFSHCFLPLYSFDLSNGAWHHTNYIRQLHHLDDLALDGASATPEKKKEKKRKEKTRTDRLDDAKDNYLKIAKHLAETSTLKNIQVLSLPHEVEQLRWFWLPHEMASQLPSKLPSEDGIVVQIKERNRLFIRKWKVRRLVINKAVIACLDLYSRKLWSTPCKGFTAETSEHDETKIFLRNKDCTIETIVNDPVHREYLLQNLRE